MALQPNSPVPHEPTDDFDIVEPLCAVFRKKLRSEGLKYTPERAQVLDTIMRFDLEGGGCRPGVVDGVDGHCGVFEADRVIDDVKKKGFRVSKATVYRTIKLLQDAGIVQRVLLGEEMGFFQLVYGRRPQAVIIRLDAADAAPSATEVVDVPALAELCERLCRERGLLLRSHRLQIFATGA